MESNEPNPEIGKEKIPLTEQVRILVDTEDEATQIIKDFWAAMPHGNDLTQPTTNEGWRAELTMGDRTLASPGKLRNERGRWVVVIRGNHQYLTEDATRWLVVHGFIQAEQVV